MTTKTDNKINKKFNKAQSNNQQVKMIDPAKWLQLDNSKTIKHFSKEDQINFFLQKQYRRKNASNYNDATAGSTLSPKAVTGKPDGNRKFNAAFWTTPNKVHFG